MHLHRILIVLIVLPTLGWPQEPLPEAKATYQRTRRSSRHDLELKISVDLASVGDSSKAESLPVNFTVKNISTAPICLAHYGDDYTGNVEILQANKIDEKNALLPLATAGGGSTMEIAPGESLTFNVPVPISLFKIKDVQFLAGVRYNIMIAADELFEGEALSDPFLLPPIPALSTPAPSRTPAGTPRLPISPTGTPAPIAEDRERPAASSPAPTVAESPTPVLERKSPVWPWFVVIIALIVVATLVLKRRA